ncbi:glycosyltransferase family 4 protein [Pedobacter sp. PWIIR3]
MSSTRHPQKKLILLTLDSFNNDGGIQSVCRSLGFALQSISQRSQQFNFYMKSLYDVTSDDNYICPSRFQGFNGNVARLIGSCFRIARRTDTIILSHVNLLPVAFLLSIFKRSIKIILIAHGTEIWRPLSPWKIRFIKRKVVIWSVSNYTKSQICEIHKIDDEKIHVLHNCLDPFFKPPSAFRKPEQLLTKYGLKKDQKILLTLSRITRHERDKGHEKVLDSLPGLLKEFPTLHYIICGRIDPDELDRLKRIINHLNLTQNVSLLGFIPQKELVMHYSLCDLFVLPSKKEGFGLVFIEAAACGCDIISGNKDGSIEAMLYGQLGMMVDPNDNNQIRKAIRKSLSRNRQVEIAFKRQNLCLSMFTQRTYQDKILALLK